MKPPLVIFSDLDGCLLDGDTYRYDEARPALRALVRLGVPLVLASSKTRSEMEPLVGVLRLAAPFIVENGGAIVIPKGHYARTPPGAREDGERLLLELGAPRPRLLRMLAEIAAETGARVRGFFDLTPGELRRLTGLPRLATFRALRRQYDEPFSLEGGAPVEALRAAAESRGLRITHGGRFHHLTGDTDKGRAALVLRGLYEAEGRGYQTAALGDAAADLPLLRAVHRPIVVPRPDGSIDETLASGLPGSERAPASGPAGWNEAVLAVLGRRPLPVAQRGA